MLHAIVAVFAHPHLDAETYVHVGSSRFAQVATYADRQEPVQTSGSTGTRL